jgi:DNA-binding PadR family transcriptional regulator
MNDPSLTNDERRVLETLRDHPERTERDMNVARPIINSLVRRGLIKGDGREVFRLTTEGRRVVGKKA